MSHGLIAAAGCRPSERLRDDKRQALAHADISQDVQPAFRSVLAGKRLPAFPRNGFRRHLERGERLLEHTLAKYRGLALLQRFQEMPNPRARLAGRDEIEPGRVWP